METKERNPGMEILMRMLDLEDRDVLEELLKGIRNNCYRYLISLDMGCGGTSCAVSTFSSAPKLRTFAYREIDLRGGWSSPKSHLSIPTMIGYDEQGYPVIGPDALDCGAAAENFKEVPTPQALNYQFYDFEEFGYYSLGKIWTDYFSFIFGDSIEKAKAQYPDINCSNVLFVVAHPASEEWEAQLSSYRELIAKSTKLNPWQIVTFSEAKAAMQYVQSCRKIQADWSKGVLVVDLGASTIDVAYLKRGIGAPIECSIKMAGQQVDRLLGHALLEKYYPAEMDALRLDELPDEAFFEKHWDDLCMRRSYFAYAMRMGKEDICDLGNTHFFIPASEPAAEFDLEALKSILRGRRFFYPCSDPGLAAFLNDGTNLGAAADSWYGHLEKLISYMIQERIPMELKARGFSEQFEIDKVIATGGTANLVGVGDTIRNGLGTALSLPNEQLVILNEPADYERTVPYGSAVYIQNVISGLDTLLGASKAVGNALKEDLMAFAPELIQSACTPAVEKAVNRWLDWWKNLNICPGYQGSIAKLRNTLQTKVEIEQSKLDEALRKAEIRIREKARIMDDDHSNMKKTYASIQEILQKLARSNTIEEMIEIQNLSLRLDHARMSKAVRRSAPAAYYNYIDSESLLVLIGKALVLYITTKANIAVPKIMRVEIVKALKADRPFQSEVHSEIKAAFAESFDASKGFGSIGQIMTTLENKIINAMFLSDWRPNM